MKSSCYTISCILLSLCLSFQIQAQDQSTSLRIYDILQKNCASCHSHDNPRAGLDLEGSGANTLAKATMVYNNVVGVAPKNAVANAKGHALIQPGRVDKSFLFKKINQGLEKTMHLEEGEESPMPIDVSLSDVEKELVRQWIIWGAPIEGTVVEEEMLVDYYSGKGKASFPAEIPAAPDPSEGFQLKFGQVYQKIKSS